MSATNPKIRLSGIARRLVQGNLLTAEAAEKAVEQSQSKKIPLVSYLCENKILPAIDIATAAAEEFGMPLFDINSLDTTVVPETDEKIVRQFNTVPIYKTPTRIYIAISDPSNQAAFDNIKFHFKLHAEAVIVEEDKLKVFIEKILEERSRSAMSDLNLEEGLENIEIEGGDPTAEDDGASAEEDAPIVKFVNKVLLDAINRKASDIHFEPYEFFFRIRFRMDGVLQEVARMDNKMASRLLARVKVMSKMDIAERRVPQDGRIKMKVSKKRAIDFRVNSCPTLWGEKIVLRILDADSAKLGIDVLGYEDEQKQLYLNALSKPQGLILVTGPTGSGKTVSLYTGINILNTEDRNISTAEDPAEINLPGINQVNVQAKVGLTFAAALKAFLRQDPDVIMVGEIRDLETAEIAIKAAQTGHLVLSTLHTNDAPQTITRLMNMGVPHYNIATAITLIIAQRLGRRLCKNCRLPDDATPEALIEKGFSENEVHGLKIYKANPEGCEYCTKGYKGRVGFYQVMPNSESISKIIMNGGNAIEIGEQAAREGVATIRETGLKKVRAGITSIAEVDRVTIE